MKPSLDLSAQGSFQVDFTEKAPSSTRVVDMGLSPPVSINQCMVAMANDSLNTRSLEMGTESTGSSFGYWHQANFWTFTERDLGTMKRFRERTVMTIGTKKTAPAYRDCVYQLAFQVCPGSCYYLRQISHARLSFPSTPFSCTWFSA
jgi:hypothetical protein